MVDETAAESSRLAKCADDYGYSEETLGSADNLLTEFTSHVYLGQWECARACALTALRAPFTSHEQKWFVKEYIRGVSALPATFSTCANPLLLSPNHLSWLAAKFLEDYCDEKKPSNLAHDAELRVLLCTIGGELPDACRQELYEVYCAAAQSDSDRSSLLSSSCLSSLKDLFLNDPARASLLVEHISQHVGEASGVTQQLWLVHLDALRSCLERVQEALSAYEEIHDRQRCLLLKLLVSLPDPLAAHCLGNPEWANGLLDTIIGDLLNLIDGGLLSELFVFESVVCRKSPLLSKLLTQRENERHGRLAAAGSPLSLAVSEVSGQLDLKEAFLKSFVREEHFLEAIINTAVKKLHKGESEAALRLFAHPVLQDFYIIALFRAWNEVVSDNDASCVLKALDNTKAITWNSQETHSFLMEMRYRLFVTEWIISLQRRRKTSLTSMADVKARHRTIFGMLQHQSVLRVLHKTLGLGELDRSGTFRLLSGQCLVSGESVDVMYHSSPARSRDCALYRGYLAMQHAMNAMHSAIVLHHLGCSVAKLREQEQLLEELPDDLVLRQCDSLADAVAMYGFGPVHKHVVLDELEHFEEEVGQLHPLTFRLEVLENVFSLLFVTHVNLRRDASDDEDATDAEDDARSDEHHSSQSPLEVSVTPDARDTESDGDTKNNAENQAASVYVSASSSVVKETSDSLSGKGSTASSNAANRMATGFVGFLCPPFLVPSMLASLSTAVLATQAELFNRSAQRKAMASGGGDSLPQEPPVSSSVSWEELPSRLDQLRKHVVEAQWRYELVTSSEPVPEEDPPVSPVSPLDIMKESSEGSPVQRKAGRKPKKRRRRSSLVLQRGDCTIIEKMLASFEALLKHCLWHGNYEKAAQVVQVLNLEGTHDAQELQFSRHLEEVTGNLTNIATPANRSTYCTSSASTSLIGQAAREGLHLTMATALVDRLLCSDGVPTIPEAELLIRNRSSSFSTSSEGLTIENGHLNIASGNTAARNFAEEYGSGGPHVAAVADLALTADVPRDVAERLLALAVSKRETEVSGNLHGRVPRLTTTLEALRRFLQEANEDDGIVGAIGCCSKDEETSLKTLLVGFVDEFDAEKLHKQRAAWRQIESLYSKVRSLLDLHMPSLLSSNSSSSGDEESRVELHRSFLQLSKATVSEQRADLTFLPAVKFDFLRSVYAHARQLHKAIREASQQSKTKMARMSDDSYFWVLSQSPSKLLARLVLREEVAPSRLESLAHQMKLSLANVLAHECCPQVLLKSAHTQETQFSMDSPRVLNDYGASAATDSSRHPNYVVKCLLKGLVKLMEGHMESSDAVVTLNGARALGQSEAFASWAKGCASLAHVDLSQLHRGVGQLAFFINLTNLLTLHAAVLQAANVSEDELAEIRFVPITSPHLHQRALQERLVAYHVGQLGVVSLFYIKRRVLFCDHQMDVVSGSGRDPVLEMLTSQEPAVKKEFAPHFHPKAVFALVQGHISDPKIEVIYPETIESQLQSAVDRCMARIKAMTRQGVRMIIFPWQMHFFLTTDMQLDESCEELRTSLQQIIPDEFVVEYQKEDGMFGVVLEGALPLVSSLESGDESLTIGAKVPSHVLSYLENHCPLLVRLLKFMLPKAPRSPQLEDGVKYRGLPLDNLLAHVYGLWMQLSTPQSHAAWTAMALRGSSSPNVVWEALSGAAGQRDWISVLLIMEFVDALDGAAGGDLVFYRRCILSLLAASRIDTEQDAMDNATGPWMYAMRIRDLRLRFDCMLANYVHWPDMHALEALEVLKSECLYAGDVELLKEVSEELDRFNLYQEIAENLRRCGDEEHCSWKDIALKSASDPLFVLQKLYKFSLCDIASRWSDLHTVSAECFKIVTELNALHLLVQSPPRSSEAFKLTDGLNRDGEAFPLWQRVLDRLPNAEGKILLLDCLTESYRDCLMDVELISYQRTGIGLRMYMCINSEKKQSYSCLVNDPALLLEMLLMNAEVDSVGRSLEATASFLDSDHSPFTRDAANDLLKKYASKALELPLMPTQRSETDTTSQSAGSISAKDSEGAMFTMPLKPPPQSEWTPDAAVSCCMACHIEYFSMFSRRHHCRRCGRVVCYTCSQQTMVVEGFGQYKVRVCDDCFNQTAKLKNAEETTSESSEEHVHPIEIIDDAARGRSDSVKTPRSSSVSKHLFWQLTTSAEENAAVREQFCYNRAPSVSLSLAILEKHSNQADCATYILSLCDSLFAVLAPKNTSETFIDYGLIITMLKSLILRAKVKFLSAGVTSGVACSDAYLRRLDIVRLMVNANCQHLLPEEMLFRTANNGDEPGSRRKMGRSLNSDQGSERKLRDRLMETERMALALEVSTKCGLETSGVFAAWGLALLRAGDWSSAREKFSHCLQKLKDSGNSSSESPLLKEIIENLEKSRYPGISKAAAVFCAIGSLKSIKDPSFEVKVPVNELKGVVYSECKHYLELYGSHRSMLAFLFRHGRTTQALEYYLSKGCEVELFIEELLQPSLKQGILDALLSSLRQMDTSLNRWWPTLLAVCRSLQKRGRMHTLYAVQLFMEDYLRAAVTSIQFFERPPASGYSELHQRLAHLADARKHLETFLSKYTTWDGHRAKSTGTQVLAMSPKEVNRNVSMVNMQIDITRFLNARETEQEKLLLPRQKDSADGVVPTLFGDMAMKRDLACLVLVNGRNVEEGFGLAFRIIQENHLDGAVVFERAAQTLVSAGAVAQVERLVRCIQSCGYPDRYDTDAVVLAALQELVRSQDDKKDLDLLVKCLKKDVNKVEAYMLAGRLKTAYLLAVRQNRIDHVKRIMALAEAAGQESVRAICAKRLQGAGTPPQ
uniref:Zinc finger FYVE domain-containing protein 26 n=1 Tax=Rhipicephalus appendiculatus TaxID=34631 RepID=A0A131YW54_RHIAP